MESQPFKTLEGRVLPSNCVYPFDQPAQAIRIRQVSLPKLELFRVHVLIAILAGEVFPKLVSLSIDAVVSAKCRCKDKPGHECRPSAMLKILVKDIGRIRPKVR